MATVSQALKINDGMTPILRKITDAMNLTISAFEKMQKASGNAVDISELSKARDLMSDLGSEIKDAEDNQKRFNEKVEQANQAMNKLKGLVAGVVGAFGFSKVIDFAFGSLDLANVQNASETQLNAVLRNVGASENAFDNLKAKASEIQSKGIYGDEAMLGGAAELSTYIKDDKAIASMMDTLSNYAMGMSGGGAVNKTQMVEYATQLGKALDGTYDGLKKKGFELSDAQKKIIENGTDMEKALVLDDVIAQSWDGLYETMSNTPESKIIQVKNLLGDLRERLGNAIYPQVMKIYNVILNHQDTLERVFDGIGNALNVMFTVLSWIFEVVMNIANFFSDNWSIIEPIIWGIVAAVIAYNAVMAISTAITSAQALAEGVAGAAKMFDTGATFSATAAQWGFNAALYACPITWIVALIVVLIVAIVALVGYLIYLWNTNDDVARAFITAWDNVQLGLDLFAIGFKTIWNNLLDFIGNFKVNALTILDNFINGAIKLINDFIELLNKIPGVSIDTVTYQSTMGMEAAQKFAQEKAERDANLNDMALAYLDKKQQLEETREERVQNRQKITLDGLFDKFENVLNTELKEPTNIKNVENVESVNGTVDVSSEDLRLLREMAEQDYIQNYIYVDPNIAVNTGDINENADLDYLLKGLGREIRESIDTGLEGVPVG